MLTRSILSVLMLLFSYSAICQDTPKVKKKYVKLKKVGIEDQCVNDRTYSSSQLMTLEPFKSAATVKLVSYFKLETVNNEDRILTIINNGKFEPAKWEEQVTLSTAQVASLANLMFNLGNKKMPPMIGEAQCFIPNNAILFYDKKGSVISAIEVSFACEHVMTLPVRLNTGSWCRTKFDALRNFFETSGIRFYGMDD